MTRSTSRSRWSEVSWRRLDPPARLEPGGCAGPCPACARQSWTVNSARLAVAAPWIVFALFATRPEAAQAFNTVAGGVVLVGGAACSVVAYRLMIRIGRLPEEARVLR